MDRENADKLINIFLLRHRPSDIQPVYNFNNKIMEIIKGKHFEMKIEGGVIKCYPAAQEYYQIGEQVANKFAESATQEWRDICLFVMDSLAEQADSIKSKIVSVVSFRIYPKSTEEVKGRGFEQSKNYIEGYSDAVRDFSNAFESVEKSLEHAIEKVLPSYSHL